MAGMDLTAILTCAAAFLGGLAVSVAIYFARHRRSESPKTHVPRAGSMLGVNFATIPDGGITSGKIASGVIAPDHLASGYPRDDR